MRFLSVNAMKQTAGRGKKNERRSAEIVYFSLAKRRKIKGKQETMARDGNQTGLHPEMDFLGTSVEQLAG